MKKRILCLTLICLLLTLPVFASAATDPLVVDNAQLLSGEEYAQLTQTLEEVSQTLQMDVVVLTVPSLDGKSPMTYADDYYDYHGYGPDGVLLLVCMAERQWWISTSGSAIDALSDADLDSIGEWVVPYLSDGDYAQAFYEYATGVELLAAPGKVTFGTVLLCLVIGAVVAFIATGVMKGQLKSVRRQNHAAGYMRPEGLQLTTSRDLFLFRNVSRHARPKSNSGSTTHRSSSGRSHGGRGGSF